ncbi:MAG: cytochrome c family protein [Bacteroidota bacterium]|nr:cytochrome c family protein [Bacteroidota bacterium]
MRRILFIPGIVLALAATAAFTGMQKAERKYIGTLPCKGCHSVQRLGRQYPLWRDSKHAAAFSTLLSADAEGIAEGRGFKTNASETPECLACHVTGKMEENPVYDDGFMPQEGVGCEACHGPASSYRNIHARAADREQVREAGLVLHTVADGQAEKLCIRCHNEKSPVYTGFDFHTAWGTIRHPRP